MSIPKYHETMLPLLQLVKDGEIHRMADLMEQLAISFKLTPMERSELLGSGLQSVFENRVGWGRTYLKKAGLVESPKRGLVCITERGQKVLAENPKEINQKYLQQFEEFVLFQNLNKDKGSSEKKSDDQPDQQISKDLLQDRLENIYNALTEGLKTELISKVEKCSPFRFETIVIDLLLNMGYGGSRLEAGKAFGKSRDGGIDGIINEDRLGLDTIYIQAKKWAKESVVGRPDIQKFAGALQGVRAKKGIFITTATFSQDAQEYVKNIDSKIILIDGDRLAHYMIESNTGCADQESYIIKKLDLDYFLGE